MRELPFELMVRVWDTYMSEPDGFAVFHVYVCAALLARFSNELREMDFQELVMFLQNLPTKDWTRNDVEMVCELNPPEFDEGRTSLELTFTACLLVPSSQAPFTGLHVENNFRRQAAFKGSQVTQHRSTLQIFAHPLFGNVLLGFS
mmetsp:Transcript_6181/g.26105  ORF Transcript_6181/g.26105 Transcript_6181/m.26105 type:complete len:146 (+) Transcript_6181:2045-2482(+)